MSNETKIFSVRKEDNGYKGLEYSFEWDFAGKQTRIPISTHAAIELTDTFRRLGFTQIHPEGYNKFI